MSDMNCPYCGEPEETDTPSGITIYRCGTLIYPNGSFVTPLICDLGRDLRREREAHNNTKRERDEAREKLDEEMKWHHRTHTELVHTQCKILDMQMGRDEALEELIHLRSCVYDVIHSLKAGAFDELEKAWKKGLK